MADPFSIAGGVVGILSSLASLSQKINEFRRDAQGAKSEIRELAREVEDLSLVLAHLKVAKEQGMIASSLETDLGTVLQRLGEMVSETESFLERCKDRKRTAPIHWAFSGKSQCLQLCRRLESYKSTITVSLTLSSVFQGYDNHAQGDQVLNGIQRIRRQLSVTRNDDILQRYLLELETVYEGSSLANPSEMSDVEPLTTTSLLGDVETDMQLLADQAANRPISSPGAPVLVSRQDSGIQENNPRRIADDWTQLKSEPSHTHHLQHGLIQADAQCQLASRGGQFAACLRVGPGPYGVLFRGLIGQPSSPSCLELDGRDFDPPQASDGSAYDNRRVVFMRFRSDGALIAALACFDKYPTSYSYLRLFVWESIATSFPKAISPGFRPILSMHVTLSRDCRRFACCESYHTVTIYDIGDNAVQVCKIENAIIYLCTDVVWIDDSTKLLVHHYQPDDHDRSAISVFDAANGSCIASVDFAALSIPEVSPSHFNFFALGQQEVVAIHFPWFSDPSKFAVEDMRKPSSQPTKSRHFIARIDLRTKKMTPIRVGRDKVRTLYNPSFSPDGSCVIVQPIDDKDFKDEGFFMGGPLYLFDTRTGHSISRVPCSRLSNDLTSPWTFDHDGRLIVVAEYLQSYEPTNTFKLSFWEPATTT